MRNPYSFAVLLFCCLFLSLAVFIYYPKWKNTRTEATISWDVSGYYLYLPAFFIYKDAEKLEFAPKIIEQYYPVPNLEQQAFPHESGSYVMKYPAGQALQWLPFFALAHVYALNSKYPADGFSVPYQFMISLGSLMIAFIGLWFMRKALLEYFSDKVTAIALFFLVLGTNYLAYASINGAMTHNNLFTIYAILIYLTIQFYKTPTFAKALGIGLLVGLAGLTRPTELMSLFIPVLWGIQMPLKNSIIQRFHFFKEHLPKLLIAIIACGLVGSIQLIYWKYITDHWLVYSYQDQGFSWLYPHLKNGLFSYRSGWLLYTPIMMFALIGFIPLYKKHNSVFWTTLAFAGLFIYVAFAWDIWWYGGSLGQRTMVQCYPVLLFPFAAFIHFTNSRKYLPFIIYPIFLFFSYFNLWITHQAYRGGLFMPEQMNRAYFQKIFLKYKVPEDALKLLDTNSEFKGVPQNMKVIYQNNFENDIDIIDCGIPPIQGQRSYCLTAEHQESPVYKVKVNPEQADWIRATATFRCRNKEWHTWSMANFIIRFYDDGKEVGARFLRVYRFLDDGETERIYFDAKPPRKYFNEVGVVFWNANSDKPLAIDEVQLEAFQE